MLENGCVEGEGWKSERWRSKAVRMNGRKAEDFESWKIARCFAVLNFRGKTISRFLSSISFCRFQTMPEKTIQGKTRQDTAIYKARLDKARRIRTNETNNIGQILRQCETSQGKARQGEVGESRAVVMC